MARKRYSDEHVLKLLREIELKLTAGDHVALACRSVGISDATYYNWRKRFGGMGCAQLLEMKSPESENARLKKIVAEPELDKLILQESQEPICPRTAAEALCLGKVKRQIVCKDAVPEFDLRTRDDLVGLRQLLDDRGSDDQWIVKELHGADLKHVQNDLGILWVVLIPTVMQSLARPSQTDRGDKLQLEPSLTKMVHQRAVTIAGRLSGLVVQNHC